MQSGEYKMYVLFNIYSYIKKVNTVAEMNVKNFN